MTTLIHIILCLGVVRCGTSEEVPAKTTVHFENGKEYWYDFEGMTTIHDAGTFLVHAKIGIVPLNSSTINEDKQVCRLIVEDYHINLVGHPGTRASQQSELDFSKWTCFEIRTNGEITAVYSTLSEEPLILSLKKIILSFMSTNIVISESQELKGKRWGYKVNETDTEGVHSAIYQAEPHSSGKVSLKKTREHPSIKGVHHVYEKVVTLHRKQNIPEYYHADEERGTPNKTTKNSGVGVLFEDEERMGFPSLGGKSYMEMKIWRIIENQHFDNFNDESFIKTSLVSEALPPEPIDYTIAENSIKDNLTSIEKLGDTRESIPCFRDVVLMMERLSFKNVQRIVATFRTTKYWIHVLDVLGSVKTNYTLTLLCNEVLKNESATYQELMNTLVHFAGIKSCLPLTILEDIEKKALIEPWKNEDKKAADQVKDRALLILGVLVDVESSCNKSWSQRITRELESRVGVHDPWHHREMRATKSTEEIKVLINKRAVDMHALGNAAQPSSYDYFVSYLNSSESHMQLKFSAVHGLSKYHIRESAQLILKVALTDIEENIRLTAIEAYKNHPHGGDLPYFMEKELYKYNNLTSPEHSRMRRDLMDVLNAIWKGFQWRLIVPGVSWMKATGSKKLGASMGLIFKNMADIKISPLNSHLKVDVFDKAWVTIHLGMINYDFDVFKAELCYKGTIGYNLNIFAEFDFNDIASLAELLSNNIIEIVDTVKSAITTFKDLFSKLKDLNIKEFITDFIDSVKSLPLHVSNLRKDARTAFKALGKYTDLPMSNPIRELIVKVSELFNNVQTDVMEVYTNIVDPVLTTIPWAFEEVWTAINDMIDVFKNLFKNPSTCFQNLGRIVAKISVAVAAILDVKEKIVEVNIFDGPNRPYWLDIDSVVSDITNDLKEIEDTVTTTDWEGKDSDSYEAQKFTGVDLGTMRKTAVLEIIKIIKEDLLTAPVKQIENIFFFLKKHKIFKDLITSIKKAWQLLLNGYRKGKELITKIFGTKTHKIFPRKFLSSASCGFGFWETTGKGNYRYPGVHTEIAVGAKIVAPFNGYLYESGLSGEYQVTIDVFDLKNTSVLLDNVKIDQKLNRREVGAGDVIGTVVHPRWCEDGHVHISMRKINSSLFIDPTKYIEKREIMMPGWIEECDHYILTFLGKTIQAGNITNMPEKKDKSPKVKKTKKDVNIPKISVTTLRKRGKRSILDNVVDKLQKFTKSIGLESFDKLKEVFNLNINNITLKDTLEFLNEAGMSELSIKIVALLEKIENFSKGRTCVSAYSLDDQELKAGLLYRGKSTMGTRRELMQRYVQSDSECHGLQSAVKENVYCSFQSDCLGLSCCLDLDFFIYRQTFLAYVSYDPCANMLTMGINEWTKLFFITSKDFAIEGTGTMDGSGVDILEMAQLFVHYNVIKEGSHLKVSLDVQWCSTLGEDCLEIVRFLQEAKIHLKDCTLANRTSYVAGQYRQSANRLLASTIKEVIDVTGLSGLDDDIVHELSLYLREAFQSWLKNQIQKMTIQIFGNEFNRFDLCFSGNIPIGPNKVTFFSIVYPVPMGPLVVTFRLGAAGYFGVDFGITVCMLSMKVQATAVPQIGIGAYGGIEFRVGPFVADILLQGYIMTTSFPTKAELSFTKFPIELKARMDLQLTPVHLTLHVKLVVSLFLLGEITLMNKMIWSFTTKSININIFNYNDAKPDDTPPDFSWYGGAEEFEPNDKKKKKKRKNKRRKGRSLERLPGCEVFQVPGRDYTDPSFILQLGVNDDKSTVYLTYCVGTFSGGCDIVNNDELGGPYTTVERVLPSGQSLHFTVTAKNNAGVKATTVCEMTTYDMSLPTGRVIPQFYSTSHPGTLKASVFMTDDSLIMNQSVSIGYGRQMYGQQILDWQTFESTEDNTGYTGSDPMTQFSNPKDGKLAWLPFYSEKQHTASDCANQCLLYQPTKCQGFNYDHSVKALCELLDIVEGEVELKKSSSFYYYERLGIGHVAMISYDNLQLQHNTLNYFNVYLNNELGYTNVLSSQAVLVDLTTPYPGYIQNEHIDTIIHQRCDTFTPDDVKHRCVSQTTIPNYRYIKDGEGSRCIFNGHKAMVDEIYTRSNLSAAANWDGIYDNETGILMYTWSVGQEACGSNIHPHTDPHSHLHQESEWKHQGIAYPLHLQDGIYYVTVRAINKVDYGGPLALTVCHSQPFTVDNTPPIIHSIGNAVYNETTMILTALVNASDDLSLIKQGEVGLGQTRRDTYILEWQKIPKFNNIILKFKLPDGLPVWLKSRVTNNVDLKTVGHASKAFFVDQTPPVKGFIYHGTRKGVNSIYQWQQSVLCVTWEGFYDPESGISIYQLTVGTAPNLTDVQENIEVAHSESTYCFEKMSLLDKTVYYVTMVAINGADDGKNVSLSSSGVLIDTSPPFEGKVRDNLPNLPDTNFSSDPATLKASWGGFSDPESGIEYTNIIMTRKSTGSSADSIIHTETGINSTVNQIEMHHFHFRHKDEVHVAINVTNGAGRSTQVKSNGFTVDLTKPIKIELNDGYNVSKDRQYSASLTALAATWDFQEQESSIVNYKFAAFLVKNHRIKRVYPKYTDWKELSASTKTFETDEAVILQAGSNYFIRLTVLNGAGLAAVHDTDGVIIDNTPPSLLYVHSGILAGEAEELIDGFVLMNNLEWILGSWHAVDPESGISEYLISVGTSPGAQDVMTQKSYGQEMNAVITDINLSLTDKVTNLPVYYIGVVAVNGAGMRSTMEYSSPVKIVEADQEGVVWDGPGVSIQEDTDSLLSHHSVTFHFSGFVSALHGIVEYQWAIGTKPKYDDVKEFSNYGIILNDHTGLSTWGNAQYVTEIYHSKQYFVTVKAITGVGNSLIVSSDGFSVDETPAIIEFDMDRDIQNQTVIYQNDQQVEISWTIEETESDIDQLWILIGTFPGNDDIKPRTILNDHRLQSYSVKVEQPGKPYYLQIMVANEVGLVSKAIFRTIVLDNTPATEGTLICPSLIASSEIICKSNGIYEEESIIESIVLGIGSQEGYDDVWPFTKVENDVSSYTVNKDILKLVDNFDYFATLKVKNAVSMTANIYSLPMNVDTTPPISGLVIELPDYYDINLNTPQDSGSSEYNTSNSLMLDMDSKCQRDLTKVEIAWDYFTDDESLIDFYEVSLGISPGSGDIYQYTKVNSNANRFMFYPIDLYHIKKVYATVRGYNMVGLSTIAVSNGVYISRYSSGYPPLTPLKILDGRQIADINYQYQNDRISVHWDLSGDPCPVSSVQWSVLKFDGTVVSELENVSPDQNYAELDEIPLYDKESFFAIIKVTNLIGHAYSIHSDGVTIELQPLIPGYVRDGDIAGVDLNFQPSITSLSANWDSFGSDSDKTADVGNYQAIHHYEVAVGTDRRYPITRTSISPFVDVGLNKSYTFNDLQLVPKTGVYYVTVRAYSLSSTMVEVTSNGIRTGYGGHIIYLGTIDVYRYITSTSTLSFSWSEFKFLVPIMRYYWGLKSGEHKFVDIDCTHMVGMDQVVEKSDLNLTHQETYTACVISIDQSGTCAVISELFTVDTTPPQHAVLGVGSNIILEVLYIPYTDKLSTWWSSFNDSESGIDYIYIALMAGINCYNYNPGEMTTVVDFVELPAESKMYTFLQLVLKVDQPYYVVLEATNMAGLKTTSVSKPILVEITQPAAGRVADGVDFKTDAYFIGTSTLVKGSFLYLPNPNAHVCPLREYTMSSKENWSPIVHKGMWLIPLNYINNVIFKSKQVYYSTDGMSLVMEYDVETNNLLSGAVMTRADIAKSGRYEIKPAGNLNSVTAVTFADWDYQVFSDLSSPLVMNITNTLEEASQTLDYKDYKIIPDPLPGDTFPNGYGSTKPIANSFGFHIVKDDLNQSHVTLWAVTEMNMTRYIDNILLFDPSTDWHIYTLLVNDKIEPDNENDWSLTLLIDGKDMAEMSGISSVNRDAVLLIGLYNDHGIYHNVDNIDVFNVPSATAMFRNFKFSASADNLCRYGEPFQGSDHPIVKFYAGLGSSQGLTDTVSYKEIAAPCIPCQNACDEKICETTCKANEFQLIQFELNDLNLTAQGDSFENITLPKPYFLAVKGITGSGKSAIASSNGFYIDPTPPLIQNIYHVDLAWNDYEPSSYQSSNSSIFVFWEGIEDESEVVEYKWAIGTAQFKTDIQEFVSTGLDTFGLNKTLEGQLIDGTTYYATIMAINLADLSSNFSSSGVTVQYQKPDVSGTKSTIEDTSPLGNSSKTHAVTSKSQDRIKFSWEEPKTDRADRIYCGVGTSPSSNDVFPDTPCGLNNSGSVEISNTGVSIDNAEHANLTDIRTPSQQRKKRSLGNQLLLEPGRIIHPRVKVCNRAHLCDHIPMDSVIVMKQQDRIIQSNATGYAKGRFLPSSPGNVEYIEIKTADRQENDFYLIVGLLSSDDLISNYKSEATNNFYPYIVDPNRTINKTSRELYHRVISFMASGFYISSLPSQAVNGPLIIRQRFPVGTFSNISDTEYPTLLMWCPKEAIWVNAAGSCIISVSSHVDWNERVLTTPICHNQLFCQQQGEKAKRTKRQADQSGGFSGPQLFMLGGINPNFVNYPPSITSVSQFTLPEDSGTLKGTLTAQDLDNDNFIFLRNNSFKPMGNFTLISTGDFSYTPCSDCNGVDVVHFIVKEERLDGNKPLETHGVITFSISAVNDNPKVIMIENESAHDRRNMFIVEQNLVQHHGQSRLEGIDILLVAYDVDHDSVELTINAEKLGTTVKYNQVSPSNISFADCSQSLDNIQQIWNNIANSIKNKTEFSMPIPCSISEEVINKTYTWIVNLVTYIPDVGVIGQDGFKVIANDSKGSLSKVLTVDIFILANPCLNNAKCKGPVTDENCTSITRSYGFENYTCVCQAGYSGQYCEYDIDECLSQPCVDNFTCIDQLNSYKCKCEIGWPCSAVELETEIKIIIGGAVLLVLTLVIFCIAFGAKYCCCENGDRSEADPLLHRNKERYRYKHGMRKEPRALKVVGAYRVRSPGAGNGSFSNEAFDDVEDYSGNRFFRAPKYYPQQNGRRIHHSSSSDSYASIPGRSSHIRRWFPQHLEDGSLYSSRYSVDRSENMHHRSRVVYDGRDISGGVIPRRGLPTKVKRLRRNAMDLNY